MSKITDYAASGTAHSDDLLVVVDVHDTSMAATGTDKRMTLAQLVTGLEALGMAANVMTTTGDLLYASSTASPAALARLPAGTAGQVLTIVSGLPAWVSQVTSSAAAEPLSSGEAIFPRYLSAASPWTPASGTTYLTYWVAGSSGTCSAVTTYSGATAASGLTYANVGVYSVAPSTGNLTLLVSTGDIHATAWAATNTAYTTSWASSATFSRVAGSAYALALIILGAGGTMPVINGYTGIADQLALPSLAVPQVAGTINPLQCNSAGQISTIATWSSPSPGVLATFSAPASAGWPASGTLYALASGNTYAVVTYTGLTSSSFTGCAYVSGSPTGSTFAYSGIYPSTGFLPISGSSVGAGANAMAAVVAP